MTSPTGGAGPSLARARDEAGYLPIALGNVWRYVCAVARTGKPVPTEDKLDQGSTAAKTRQPVEVSSAWLGDRIRRVIGSVAKADFHRHAADISSAIVDKIVEAAHLPSKDSRVQRTREGIEASLRKLVFQNPRTNRLLIEKWAERVADSLDRMDRNSDGLLLVTKQATLQDILYEDDLSIEFPDRYSDVANVLRQGLNVHLEQYPQLDLTIRNTYRDGMSDYARFCLRKSIERLTEEMLQLNQESGLRGPFSAAAFLRNIRAITADHSFLDTAGAIPFERQEDTLSIGAQPADSKATAFERELRRSVGQIQRTGTPMLLANVDKDIPYLFREYVGVLKGIESDGTLIYSLWSIGHELEDKLQFAESRPDSPVDAATIRPFTTMFLAHHLYLYQFPWLRDAVKDHRLAGDAFGKLSDTSQPARIVGDFANEDVFDPKTQQIMASSLLHTRGRVDFRSEEREAVVVGALRGSLNAMGQEVVTCLNGALCNQDMDADADVAESLLKSLRADPLAFRAFMLLLKREEKLLELAEASPRFFRWLHKLLALVNGSLSREHQTGI
jgi:hypothetical protein